MRVILSKFTTTTPPPQIFQTGGCAAPRRSGPGPPLGMTPVQTKGERWKSRTAQTCVLGIGLYIAQAV